MLAAWMRMKFPSIVKAAVVSGGALEEFHGYEKAPNFIFFSWLNAIYNKMGGLEEKNSCDKMIAEGLETLISFKENNEFWP